MHVIQSKYFILIIWKFWRRCFRHSENVSCFLVSGDKWLIKNKSLFISCYNYCSKLIMVHELSTDKWLSIIIRADLSMWGSRGAELFLRLLGEKGDGLTFKCLFHIFLTTQSTFGGILYAHYCVITLLCGSRFERARHHCSCSECQGNISSTFWSNYEIFSSELVIFFLQKCCFVITGNS